MQVAIKSGAPQQSVAARGVHDHGYPGHAAKGTDDIPPVGPEPVQGHAPGERTGDKHTTVGGQDPTEMGVRLQCGEEPIDPKRNNSESRPKPTRCSRTPCHTSHAPPISATAARTNSRIDRTTMVASLRDPLPCRPQPIAHPKCFPSPALSQTPVLATTMVPGSGAAVRVEHGTQRLQGFRMYPMEDVHAPAIGNDQAGLAQLGQVVADGAIAEAERRR